MSSLYSYQLEGIRFLKRHKSVLLADDTGIGKTIQAIKACEELKLKTLVICPNYLKYQWGDEIRKWSNLKPQIINGTEELKILQFNTADFVIINYEKVLSGLNEINKIPYDCVILDEAQRIRNPDAKVTKLIKKLRPPIYKYLLTATPVENYITDLYSLLEFMGTKVVQDIESILTADRGGYTGYVKLPSKPTPKRTVRSMIAHAKPENLEKALAVHMLRRTKAEIDVEFPSKTEITLHMELTPEQYEMYRDARDKLLLMVDDRTIPITSILAKITYLREICDSTQLINPSNKFSYKLTELIPLVCEIVGNGNKVVIFSEFRRMTDIILEALTKLDIECSYLHGNMTPKAINEEKNKFNKSAKVCICTKTGELGHNLEAASYVINFEPPFNPARLKQRNDRIHRLTQRNKVIIYNFITRNTYEIRMTEILAEKQHLFDAVIDKKIPYRDYIKQLLS